MTPSPSPESLVEAKRLIFVLIDEKNAVVGEHIHTTLEECADSIAFALDAARLEEREACAEVARNYPMETITPSRVATAIRNRT